METNIKNNKSISVVNLINEIRKTNMVVALNAEQEEFFKIFKIEEQYVIPEYQRFY